MNGKLINKMIQEENLILLNINSRCKGTYTSQRGKQKIEIDIIANGKSMWIRKI